MNFIDASGVLADSAQLLNDDKMAHDARSVVQSIVDAYDVLEPAPERWPNWANWYYITADMVGYFTDGEPELYKSSFVWNLRNVSRTEIHMVYPNIPLGIDLRLCKWQRPEAQP